MSNLKGKKLSIFKQFQGLQVEGRQRQTSINPGGQPSKRLRSSEFVKMKITIPGAEKLPSISIQSFASLPSPKSDSSRVSARSFLEEQKIHHKKENFLRRGKYSGTLHTSRIRDSQSFHSFDDRQIRQNTQPSPQPNEYQLRTSQQQSKFSYVNIQPGLRVRTLESEISTETTPKLTNENEGVLPSETKQLNPDTKLLKSVIVRLPKQKYTFKEMDFQIPEIDENDEENGEAHQVMIGAVKSSIRLLGGMSLKQSQRVYNPKQQSSEQSDQSLKSSQKVVTFSTSDIGMKESGKTNNLTTSESLSINSNFTCRNIKLNKIKQRESFKSNVQSDFTENDEEFNIWDNQNDVRVAVAISEMDSEKNKNIEEFLKLYKIRYGVFPGQEQQISNEEVIQTAVKYMGKDKKLFKKYFPNREVKFEDNNDYSKPYEVTEDINFQNFKEYFDNSPKKVAPLVTFTIPKVPGRVFKESTFRRYRSEKSNITHASTHGNTSDGGFSNPQD